MAGKRISLTLVLVILAGILLIMGAFRTVRAASEIPENGWLGPENPISPIQTPIDADRYHPAVAYNSNHHQYLVVWHNQWPGSKDIYGQRLDSLGRLLGPWFSISSGPNDRLDPAVAYNAIDDEYLIVYRYDASTNGTRYELMAQRINWDGNKIGSPFQIVTAADRTYSTPRVIWKEAYDEYLIVWGTRDTATGLPTDIGEKLIDHEGTVRYATVISSADYPYDPDMIWDPIQERYLIVWCHINASGKKAVMGDIRDGNANRMGGIVTPFIIYSSTTNDLWSPRVGTNGIFFFTAFEYVYSDSDHDIYGAWVNSDATLVIPVGLVTSGANEITPALATSLDRQEIMVLFERASTGPQEVWLKPISNTISADEVSICNYDYWDCISAAGAWGDPGYLFTYASHGIVIPDGKYHIYGRFYATNVVYLPLIKKKTVSAQARSGAEKPGKDTGKFRIAIILGLSCEEIGQGRGMARFMHLFLNALFHTQHPGGEHDQKIRLFTLHCWFLQSHRRYSCHCSGNRGGGCVCQQPGGRCDAGRYDE